MPSEVKRLRKDLSKVDKTVTNWLDKHLNEVNQLVYDKEKFFLLLESIKNECQVSNMWYSNFINTIKQKHNNKEILLYIYNVYLRGSKMGMK